MKLSQREAAKAWGVGRNRLRADIASGKLSVGQEKKIDPAELQRVYGPPSGGAFSQEPSPPLAEETAIELATLKERVVSLEEQLRASREVIEVQKEAIMALKLLTHEAAKPLKKRWWPFG